MVGQRKHALIMQGVMPKRGGRSRRLSVLTVPVYAATQFKGSVLSDSWSEVHIQKKAEDYI